MTFPFPTFMPGVLADAACTFTASSVFTANASSYTATAASLGAEASNRYIFVAVVCRNADITAVSAGGVSLTKRVDGTDSGSYADIWSGPVPSGTTGDVVLTASGTADRAAVAVYRVVNLLSETPVASGTSVATNHAVAMNVTAGGFVIGVAYGHGATGAAWTNLDENVDQALESQHWSSAHRNFAAAQTALSFEIDFTGTETSDIAAYGSFR